MSDLVGSVVADRWEIVAFAGAGGMGSVFRARDKTNDATVALTGLGATIVRPFAISGASATTTVNGVEDDKPAPLVAVSVPV